MNEERIVAVLGLGLFGIAVAKTLAKNGVEVIAIDKNMNHVEEVSNIITNAVQGDFTKIDNLQAAFVDRADTAIVATGEQLEVTITAIFHLKKLGVKNIIVKTKNMMYKDVLEKVGADRVLLPEVEIGIELGSEIAQARVQDLLELDDDYHIIEIESLDEWQNKTLRDLDLVGNSKLNVLGVKDPGDDKYSFLVESNYVFKKGDRVVLLSGNKEINNVALELETIDE